MTKAKKAPPPPEEEEEVEELGSSADAYDTKSSCISSTDHDGTNATTTSSSVTELKQLAPLSDVFSYGTGWVKVVCLSLGFFFAVVEGAVAPAMIFYFAKAFEDLAAPPESEEFMDAVEELTWIFLGLGVVAFCSLCAYATLLETSAGNMAQDFKKKWFEALLRQDMAYFDIQDVSGVATLISTNGAKYKRGVGVKLGLLVQFICTFLGGFIYAFYSSWQTSLVVLCTVPFMAISGWFLVKMTSTSTQRANAAYAKAGSVAYTTVSSIRTILSLNAVTNMIEQFTAATAQAYKDATSQVAWLGVANGCMMGSFLLSSIVVPLYGGSLIWKQVQDSGCDPSGALEPLYESCDPSGMDVFGAMFGIFLSASALPQISTILESITQARVACFLAQEIMNRKEDETISGADTTKTTEHGEGTLKSEEDALETAAVVIRRGQSALPEYKINSLSPHGLKPKKLKGEIEFENVTFAYPTRMETNVFENFNLKIEAGKSIAICGPSGSGKSTVVQLLERNYDVLAGSIKIDSHDLRDLNVKWLRSHIGLVQQEPKLFATSILENIRYGKPKATMEEIEEACKAANAHDFIQSFPDGYHTQVGDLGGKLSGGQKQRIAIARVCVRHPKILVLDESTSALDTESEKVVQKSLDKLMKSSKHKRTTIIIAHRLTTIRNADRIVVVSEGKVVESGTHDELLAQQGEYFKLVQSQTHGKEKKVEETNETSSEENSRHSSILEEPPANNGHPIIQFKNVKFAYPTRPEKEIFTKLNLSVKHGETLALVGPSGQGKSTIVALLERFYNPNSGSVLVNGVNLQNLNVLWWHSQVGLVSQEPVMFDLTIGENIAFGMGMKNVTQKQIEQAAKEANCHDFIMEFPDGYNTKVTSGLVSGGQKQRICIARALLRKPKILLLDEATASLDSQSEKLVQESIDKITSQEGLTTILIAHRLSSIQKADRIAVIADGKVKEIGTYEELMAKPKGHFRRLQAMQFGYADCTAKTKTKKDKKKKKKQKDKIVDYLGVIEEIDTEKKKSNAQRARLLARDDAFYFFIGGIGALLAGLVFPAWGFVFAYTIDLLYKPVVCEEENCDEYYDTVVNDMKELARNIAFGSLGTIAACLLGYILLYWGFGVATERMSERVRNDAFKSLCRQECGYFDARPVGGLTSQLQDDAALVHSFSGEPIRSLLVSLSSVVVGLVIGFYYMWPFAFVFLGILPFLAFGAEMEMKMYVTGEDEGDDTVEDENSPGGIVVESLLNVRTIASLTMEERKLAEYSEALEKEDRHPLKNNCIKGSGSGLGQFFQFWGLGLMFWFGAWLLHRKPDTYEFRDFIIAMFALFFSLYGLTVAFENATDRTRAQLAVERIFSLTDRQSAIDPLDEGGERPDDIFESHLGKKGHHHHHHHKKHKKGSSKKLLHIDDAEDAQQQKRKSSMKLADAPEHESEQDHKEKKTKVAVENDKALEKKISKKSVKEGEEDKEKGHHAEEEEEPKKKSSKKLLKADEHDNHAVDDDEVKKPSSGKKKKHHKHKKGETNTATTA